MMSITMGAGSGTETLAFAIAPLPAVWPKWAAPLVELCLTDCAANRVVQ